MLKFRLDDSIRFGNISILGFIFFQALDGVCTYWGVYLNYAPEGNPLVAFVISVMGLGLGLMIVKVLAVGSGIFLHLNGYHCVVAVLTLIGVVFAIVPWIILFVSLS